MGTIFTKILQYADLSLEEFSLHCIRGLNVCETLRDKDINDPLPKSLVSPALRKHLAKMEKELIIINKNDDSTKKAFNDYISSQQKTYDDYLEKLPKLEKKYIFLKEAITKWKEPTINHKSLKDFMIKNINDGIEFDVIFYPETIKKTIETSFSTYVKTRKANLLTDISKLKKDIEILEIRDVFIKDLKASFNKKMKIVK